MARLKPLWSVLGECAERLARRPGVMVGCDFDGTLAPIQPHPDQVSLPPRTRAALGGLAALDDVHAAVFSGRSIDDLKQRVDLPRLYLSGAGGAETMEEDGRRLQHVSPEQRPPEDLLAELQQWCERFPGAWLEDKNGAVALHYRAVEPRLQPAFGAGLRRRVNPHKGRLMLIHGKKVFELQSTSIGGKPGALQRWLARAPQPDRLVFFFGDDTHDEACYPLIRGEGGLAVAVGRLASRADYGVGTPEEVTWFLEWLLRELQAGGRGEAGGANPTTSRRLEESLESPRG
jgi:trehalose-phosphatase